MIRLGGIAATKALQTSGAFFNLVAAPRRPRAVATTEGVVHFAPNWAHALVAQDQLIEDDDELLATSWEQLQRSLDVRAISDRAVVDSKDAHQFAILWRYMTSQTYVTIMENITQGIRVDLFWEKKRDGAVIARSEDEPDPDWHESFRYLRRAATAQDVFDAYRNCYLAFEALLATVVPPLLRERDVDWIKRGLKTLGAQGLDLSQYTAGSPSAGTWVKEQHEVFRCALFHAKPNQPTPRRLPASFQQRAEVSSALVSLNLLVEEILRLFFAGASLTSGGITYSGMQSTVEAVASGGLEFGRTPDKQIGSEADTSLSPNNFPETWIAGSWSGRPWRRPDRFRFWGEERFDAGNLQSIGRVGLRARDDGILLTVTDVDDLVLQGPVHYRHVIDWNIWSKGLAANPFGP